jgi:hypothetical protein
MASWRFLAITIGVIMFVCGLVVWAEGGTLLLSFFGAVIAVTAVVERTYGNLRSRPAGGQWRPTDERFVDPETGKLVTVWYDPATGARRYVSDDGKADRPA